MLIFADIADQADGEADKVSAYNLNSSNILTRKTFE